MRLTGRRCRAGRQEGKGRLSAVMEYETAEEKGHLSLTMQNPRGPDKTAIIDERPVITYGQLKDTETSAGARPFCRKKALRRDIAGKLQREGH
jgi:hypothetical protein